MLKYVELGCPWGLMHKYYLVSSSGIAMLCSAPTELIIPEECHNDVTKIFMILELAQASLHHAAL